MKVNLAARVATSTGLGRRTIDAVIAAMRDELRQLEPGDRAGIRNLGSFTWVRHEQRQVRNLKGVIVEIPARQILAMKPAKSMRRTLPR